MSLCKRTCIRFPRTATRNAAAYCNEPNLNLILLVAMRIPKGYLMGIGGIGPTWSAKMPEVLVEPQALGRELNTIHVK